MYQLYFLPGKKKNSSSSINRFCGSSDQSEIKDGERECSGEEGGMKIGRRGNRELGEGRGEGGGGHQFWAFGSFASPEF